MRKNLFKIIYKILSSSSNNIKWMKIIMGDFKFINN
jgi:hypothetical protein